MSEKLLRSSRREYPPDKLSWIEASHLVQEYALGRRLGQRLKTALELAEEAERDTKEALRRAKEAARLRQPRMKNARAEALLVPQMGWYLKRVAAERKRLAALGDIVADFEKGKVPESRKLDRILGELVFGTHARRKVDALQVRKELDHDLPKPPGGEGEVPSKKAQGEFLRDRLQGMLDSLDQAVDYRDPAAFMEGPERAAQKRSTAQAEWERIVEQEAAMAEAEEQEAADPAAAAAARADAPPQPEPAPQEFEPAERDAPEERHEPDPERAERGKKGPRVFDLGDTPTKQSRRFEMDPDDLFDRHEAEFLRFMETLGPVRIGVAEALARKEELLDAYAAGTPDISEERVIAAATEYYRAFYFNEEDTLEGKHHIYVETMRDCSKAKRARMKVLKERKAARKRRGSPIRKAAMIAAALGGALTSEVVLHGKPEPAQAGRLAEEPEPESPYIHDSAPEKMDLALPDIPSAPRVSFEEAARAASEVPVEEDEDRMPKRQPAQEPRRGLEPPDAASISRSP